MEISGITGASTLRTLYQPIVGLYDGAVVGYEALTRGPAGEFEDPRALFARAAEAGVVEELERACWAAAIRSARALPASATCLPDLFVNVLPQTLLSDAFLEAVEGDLAEAGMSVDRVIIEITEGQRIDDLRAYAARLDTYRERGFRIALDDVGAGHAGLETFVELEPDVIKLDQNIIRSADRHPARRSIIEACVLVARRRSVNVVAEGIEDAGELRLVRDLGVAWGQGYLVGRPARPEDVSSAAAQFAIRGLREMDPFDPRNGPGVGSGGVQIGDLAAAVPAVGRSEPLRNVLPYFDGAVEAIVVVESGVPRGIVERTRLFERLARPYGRELYLRGPVEEVADPTILVVDSATSLETVSRLAMERPAEAVYGHIVVVSDRRYVGLVSIRSLLDAITSLRLEAARAANPLTGLPGNPAIEAVLRSHLRENRAIGLIHADLDDFKAFNDAHGFHRGDAAIRFTADVLSEVVTRSGGAGSFLGHIGGDDFVALVAANRLAGTVAQLQSTFRERARSAESRIIGRRSDASTHPRLDLTVAAIVVESERDWHYARVLDELAEAKRAAKLRARRKRSSVSELV